MTLPDMRVCPECDSRSIVRRVKLQVWVCKRCDARFNTPRIMPHDGKHHLGNTVTPQQRKQRIEHIRHVHEANPEYTKKDLQMVCYESYHMVSRYWKEVYNSQMTMNKTG